MIRTVWHIVANGLPLDFGCLSAEETAPNVIARAQSAYPMYHLPPEWYSMTTDEATLVEAAYAGNL